MTDRSKLTASLTDCRIIELETHPDPRGTLTVAQNCDELPLKLRRVFYIFDIPYGAERGGHAHFNMNELIIAVSGCFDVQVTDGKENRTFTLLRPNQGLFLPAGIWRSLNNFSSGAVCLTICDTDFDEADYIREYSSYLSLRSNE